MKTTLNTSLISINTRILPDEEIKKLIRIAQQDDSPKANQAIEEILNTNVRLILNCIQKIYTTEDIDDLFQVGCIGLIKAIKNFDFTYDVKFNTYAVPAITNEIRRYLRTAPIIHVNHHIRENGASIQKAISTLTQTLNREPTLDEIAEAVDMPTAQVQTTLHTLMCSNPLSLDEPIKPNKGDFEPELADTIESTYTEQDMIVYISLQQAMEKLTDQERRIIYLLATLGLKQKEAAHIMGVSQAHVSRIYNTAIRKIKKEIL